MVESGLNQLEVAINSNIRVRFHDGTVRDLRIVNDSCILPGKGIISSKSPVGKVLLGARVNDKKKYQVNGNIYTLKILEILFLK
jgi:transcription elongation GreA/GreB family factor